jgi:hypothetical protein
LCYSVTDYTKLISVYTELNSILLNITTKKKREKLERQKEIIRGK